MKSEMRGEDPVDWVRAKTAPPAVRLGYGGQFPGVRRFKRRRWERVTGVEGKANCFHVMSRLTDGLAFFEDEEKEALVVLLWKMARFCKVRVLTYCVMGNHFHALIEVPDHDEAVGPFRASEADGRPAEGALELDAGWERLLTHLGSLYSRKYVLALRAEMERYLKAGQSEQVEEVREAYLARIGDLSRFMRELKERFTKWYNKLHGRRGGIWQGRFKSVLVQGHDEEGEADGGWSKALRTMAAYIDLNPVRAGLVEDPADYRWCGYAAALGGSRRARRGLSHVMGGRRADWEEKTADEYRKLLCSSGWSPAGSEVPAADTSSEAPAELKTLAAQPVMSRGLALGSEGFIRGVIKKYRGHFGEKRKLEGHPVNWAPGGFSSLRRIVRRE